MRCGHGIRWVVHIGYHPFRHPSLVRCVRLVSTDVAIWHHLEPDVVISHGYISVSSCVAMPCCPSRSLSCRKCLTCQEEARLDCSHRMRVFYISYISANRQSFEMNVVIAPITCPAMTMYFPLENVAPLSPWMCLLAFSSNVLARVIARNSFFINNYD